MKIKEKELELLYILSEGDSLQNVAKELGNAGNTFKRPAEVTKSIGQVEIKDRLTEELWNLALQPVPKKTITAENAVPVIDWKKFDIETNSLNTITKIKESKAFISCNPWKQYFEGFLPHGTEIQADFETDEEVVVEIKRGKNVFWIKLPKILNNKGLFKKNGSLYIAKWRLNEAVYSATKEIILLHPYAVMLQMLFNETVVELLDKLTLQPRVVPDFLQNRINEIVLNKSTDENDEGIFEYINHNINDYALELNQNLISIANITTPIKGIAMVSSSANRPYKTNQLAKNARIVFSCGKFTIITSNDNVFESNHSSEQMKNMFEIKSSGKRNSNTIKATCNYVHSKYVTEFRVKKI